MKFKLDDEITFGKYKGKTLKDIIYTTSYIEWCIKNIKWFDLDEEAMDIHKNALKRHKKEKLHNPNRYNHRRSYGNHGKLSASQQGMLDCFGHTGPDGGWGNGI